MTERVDIIEVLIKDHQVVEELFAELVKGQGGPAHRRELTDQVITELVRHSLVEERFLYPVARDVLPGGAAIADRELADHTAAEQIMKDLGSTSPTEPAFATLLSQLVTDIRAHLADEETNLFPRLRFTCTEDELVDLGEQIQKVPKITPTGPALGLVDRVRDALGARR